MKYRKKGLLYTLITSALLLQPTGISYAAEPEFSLDQVVVTATKTPIKEFEANANITVITQEQIENNHYRDLSEALRNVPGVYIANYGGGVGYENSNNFRINGSDKVVVLIDGVRVNAAGVNFPVSSYNNMQDIARIEVLKGSASTLYGSEAKGGVINIITRKVEGNSTTLTTTNGSYGKEDYSLVNRGTSGDYTWTIISDKDIIGNYTDAHGLEIGQHRNADTNTFKLSKKINEKSDVTLSYDQYKADYFYTDSNKKQNLKKYGVADNYTGKIIYNYQVSPEASNTLSIVNSEYNTTYNNYKTNIKTTGVQEQFTQKIGDDHVVTAGFDFTQDEVVSLKGVKLTSRAYYAQDEWDLTRQWKLTSGLRYDNHSSFGSHLTPQVNLGYKQNDNTNYYLSYSKFFVAPTPSQLYNTSYGNPDLQPEDGKTIEAGVNHKFDHTLAGTFHVWQRHADNFIGYLGSIKKYANTNYEDARGWDIELNKQITNRLSASIGYTYTHMDPSYVGTTLNRATNYDGYLPKGEWTIGLDYRQERYDVQVQGRGIIDRVGPQTSDAFAGFFPETTYWVWDVAANYKVAKDTKIFVKINNIFDKFYAEQSNARINWSGVPGEWWTNPGRNFQVGVQYQF